MTRSVSRLRGVVVARSMLIAVLVAQLSCAPTGSPAQPRSQDIAVRTVGTYRAALNPPTLQGYRAPVGAVPTIEYHATTMDNGASQLTIPVWTPPGRHGVEPRLSIRYNSRAGRGLVGLGATLTGLSEIGRCWRTLAQDGELSTSSAPDEFCLDGVRLVRNPQNPRDFRPEGNPSVKVTSSGGTPASPVSFEARSKDGVLVSYGDRDATSHSQVSVVVPNIALGSGDLSSVTAGTSEIRAWRQDALKDRWGNSMEIDYERSSSGLGRVEVRPLEIRYTKSSVLSPSRRVRFHYRQATQPTASTSALVTIEGTAILERITVEAELRLSSDGSGPMQFFREYRLAYSTTPPGKRIEDRLATVTECYGPAPDTLSLSCSEPLALDWSDPGDEIPTFARRVVGTSTASSHHSLPVAMEVTDSAVGDFDGDGFDDYLLRRPMLNQFVPVHESPSPGTVSFRAEWVLSRGSANGLTAPVVVSPGLPGSASSSPVFSARVIDLNRDGRDEVVLLTSGSPVVQSTGDGLTTTSASVYDAFRFDSSAGQFAPMGVGEAMTMPFAAGFPIRSFGFMAGDVTGDLVPDVVRDLGTTCTGGSPCPNRLSNLVVRGGAGTTFSSPTPLLGGSGNPSVPVVIASGQEQFVLDVDGNGGPEVLIREASEPLGYDALSTTLRALSVVRGAPIETKLHAEVMEASSTGAQATGSTCSFASYAVNSMVRYFADVDGDGLADSVALPSRERDNCSLVRDWTGLMLVSRNIGGQFLPAVADRASSGALIGPTLIPNQGASIEVGQELRSPVDWAGPFRNVDNGVRIADLNRDGRADLLLVGDYVNALLFSPPLTRPTAVVRFGTPQGGFSTPRAVSGLGFATNGYFSYLAPSFGTTAVAGRGPRDRRLGDFNGDGAIDFVHVSWTGSDYSIVEDSSAQSGPDAVVSIRGVGVQTAVPKTEFSYQFAGPSSPSNFFQPGPQGCTQAELSCRRKVGWLVRDQRTEASAFDQPQPNMLTHQHSYSTARVDLNGRGWLGFERHIIVNTSLGTDSERTTSWSRFSLGGSRYTYQANSTVREGAPVQTGMWFSTSASSGTLVADPGCAFRSSTRLLTSEVTEGGLLVSRTTTATVLDLFGNETEVTTTSTDDVRTEVRQNKLLGTNASDVSEWLVSRYPTSEATSTVGSAMTRRTTDFTYLSGKVEVDTITIAKGEPLETPLTTGLTLRRTITFDSYGNAVGVTEESDTRAGALSYPPRATTTTMDARDAIVPVSSTNAEGHITRNYFEVGTGLLVATDDPNDVRDGFSYDRYLRVVETRSGLGEVVLVRFANSTSRPRFRTTTIDSDVYGLGYVERDPIGRTVRTGSPSYQLGTVLQDTVYDLNSRATAASLPYRPGRTPLFIDRDYDSLGRLMSERRPGETPTTPKFERRWEHSARRVDAFSERNIHTRTEFDFAGRVILGSTQVGGREVATTQTYGPFGLLESVSHPPLNWAMSPAPAQTNLATSFLYDVRGRVREVSDPDSGTETRLYTPFGEPKRTTDANGGVTTREYDRLGRPTLVLTPAVAPYLAPAGATSNDAQRSTFTWDTAANGKGRLKDATSVDGITNSYSYDGWGRLVGEQVSITGEGTFNFVFAYDSKSRVEAEYMPQEAVGAPPVKLERIYSALNGDLEVITDGTDSANPELLWALVARNAAGQATEEQYGPNATGSVVSRVFDPSYHLRLQQSRAASTNAVFQRLSFQWGADELLTRKSDLVLGLEEVYSHDELGRLTEWGVRQNCRNSRWQYFYDDWGNLRTRKLDGATMVENRYTRSGSVGLPHAVKQLVEGSSSQDYSYLAAGQLISGGGNAFTWRPFGLPSTVASSGGTTSSFRYDAFGSRVVETAQAAAGATKTISFGARYEKIVDPTGGAVHAYGVLTEDGQVGQIRRTTNSGGTLLSRQVQYFHRDQLGSPDVLSSSAQVIDRVKYEPFGDRRYHWAVAQPVVASHAVNASYGFTGHRPDEAHRLVNMRGRIYDPRTTRFTSPDPLVSVDSEGLNRFSYVVNSPVVRVDPSGYFSVPAGVSNALLGPSGSEKTGRGDADPATSSSGPVYETIVLGRRETSDASSGVIYAPGADGAPPDPIGVLATGLVRAYANYGGPVGVFESSSRVVAGKLNAEDWALLTFRMQLMRANAALTYFIRLRQSVVPESNAAFYRAGREQTLSVAKLWSDLAFIQAAASLGILLYQNKMPRRLVSELADARSVGATPTRATSLAEVEAAAAASDTGTLKYVVTESGELVVGPKFRGGVEIKHAVLSGGAPVQAAGEVDIAFGGGRAVGISINSVSGHYQPALGAENIAQRLFEDLGVVFANAK